MTQLTTNKQLIGKTIKIVGELDYYFLIIFTDNTFCGIKKNAYDLTPEIVQSEISLKINSFNLSDLLYLDLITEGQMQYFFENEKIEEDKRIEKMELNELARLKAKYPK